MENKTASATKSRIRESIEKAARSTIRAPGKIAEALRREECYRKAATLFVGPAPVLDQIRINALLDGKNLIMPSSGLKEGFFLLTPGIVPFPKLGLATTHKGLPQFGAKLSLAQLTELQTSLLISDALAVDQSGTRLGHGTGFFDLACAILATTQNLADEYTILGVLPKDSDVDSQPPLPKDPWDVALNGILSEKGISLFPEEFTRPEIHWQALPHARIRKISPLWQLHSRP